MDHVLSIFYKILYPESSEHSYPINSSGICGLDTLKIGDDYVTDATYK